MNNIKKLDYQKLFGEVDFRESDKSRSVYSPAAYLVDLLQLIDDEFTQSAGVNDSDKTTATNLTQRRQDIEKIELSSKQTFELLPYLDIVNERLEAKIAREGNKENNKKEAYKKLKQAKYPFNLPFDLDNERLKLYLQYLAVSAENLHKAFSIDYDYDRVAREFLGLSKEDVNLFITDVSEKENDLKKLYGKHLSNIGEKISVDTFLAATGLTHKELGELTQQNLSTEEFETGLAKEFFVNSPNKGFVYIDSDEDLADTKQEVQPLTDSNVLYWKPKTGNASNQIPPTWLDRAMRFIRLAKKTGLGLTDLDLMLRLCCDNQLDKKALQHIAVIRFVQTKYDLQTDQTCALFSHMNTLGHGKDKDKKPADLFNRIFNSKCATIDKKVIIGLLSGQDLLRPTQFQDAEYQTLTFTGDILALANKTYRQRVVHGLGISEKQLKTVICAFRTRENEDIDDKALHDRLWSETASEREMLNTLYQTRKLVQLLDISFEELFMLLDVLERDPLIPKSTNGGTLIDFVATTRNTYHILRQGTVNDRLWLVQVLCGLTEWMQDNEITAEELLKISTGLFPRNLTSKLINKKKTPQAQARQEKIANLDRLYQNIKPQLLSEKSLATGDIDTRFARRIYQIIIQKPDVLLSSTEPRLLRFQEQEAQQAAFQTLDSIDKITRDDFLGLGISEKVAGKIFTNLVLRGYLNTEGQLRSEAWPKNPSKFEIEGDFTNVQQRLFDKISELHQNYVDVGIHPSDHKFLDLPTQVQDELYDNLIFNGYLSEDGTIIQTATFESEDHLSLFEVQSRIGVYTKDVYEHLQKGWERFQQAKIVIDQDLFGDLPLSEVERADLLENLRFNDYLDRQGVVKDKNAMLSANANTLKLAIQFYPHRHGIIEALHNKIENTKAQYTTFRQSQFLDVADQLIADWTFEAIDKTFLAQGQLTETSKDYFRDLENKKNLDIAWPLSPNDNQVVFQRLQNIVSTVDRYQFREASLQALNFTADEIEELIEVLQNQSILSEERKLPQDKIPYFLNVDNALVFNIPAFEDYNKDVFFMLHDLAKRVDATIKQIVTHLRRLNEEQDLVLYQSLQEAFSLEAKAIATLSRLVFVGSDPIREQWLLPVLEKVSVNDRIEEEPQNSHFNAAYRRMEQFALLARKLKLEKEEIDIAFHDQDLLEKFPENLVLPKTKKNDASDTIKGFDALLESRDGYIYLFKSANPAPAKDYARYWVYSSVTHEQIKTEDDKLSTFLTGDKNKAISVSRVDAAFVDKLGRDVLIADDQYYVRKVTDSNDKNCVPSTAVWQLREREWGKVDNDFETLKTVDAAFTDVSERSYLFANDQFVRIGKSTRKVELGYPKPMDDWHKEADYQSLAKHFRHHLDAAFHGHDNNTYFFKNGQFVSSADPQNVQETRSVWGKIKNRLVGAKRIDAAYEDNDQVFIIVEDQVFAYRDCIENSGLEIAEGFPKSLKDHFGTNLPGQFYSDIDAAFKGGDGKLHLFKGEQSISFDQGDADIEVNDNREKWGKVDSQLASGGDVDAALAGLDGCIYLFSGRQYFRYSGSDYAEADPGYPRSIIKDWGGLISINAAFVLDGKTYLFGERSVKRESHFYTLAILKGIKTPAFSLLLVMVLLQRKAYVRYSSSDYSKPDKDFPKPQVESDPEWWNLPESLQEDFSEVDAVFNAPDGKTYLFAKDQFIYFDQMHRWSSQPSKLGDYWEAIPFASIDAAFTGKDGKTYFFSRDEYTRFSGNDYCQQDNAYPRPIQRLWGHINNSIAECGKVDAALRLESREEKKKDDGTMETVITWHTYLLSGDQYYRYLEPDQGSSYKNVELGYPKPLSVLKEEPRFKALAKLSPTEWDLEKGFDAAFADQRHVYLFKSSAVQVLSEASHASYPVSNINIDCAFMDNGGVYTRLKTNWSHHTSLEGKNPDSSAEMPSALLDVPDDTYRDELNAVLKGTDGNQYFFKGDKYFDKELNREYPIAEQWGRQRNNIADHGRIDAAFVGYDGRTYVFSGDQFVVYKDDVDQPPKKEVFNEYKQTSAVRDIAEHWDGFSNVHLAYVMGEHTYLFEKPDRYGNFRYLRYTGSDYDRPDEGYPQTTDLSYWNIPEDYLVQGWDQFDAVVVENSDDENEQTLLFIKDREFLQYSVETEKWSEPKSLDKLWSGLNCEHHLFDALETAFVGKDGTAYFFGHHCYVSYDRKSNKYSEERNIAKDWGILPNIFKDKVDAAFVYRNEVTYLFSGEYYIRYSSSDYSTVDEGYPKRITQDLRQETGFKHLPAEFEVQATELEKGSESVIIRAVVANDRHIYLFMADHWYVSSIEPTTRLSIDIFSHKPNRITATGQVDAAFAIAEKNKTYIFSGDQYLCYTGTKYQQVDDGYPKRIATGLAKDIEADLGLTSNINIPSAWHTGIDAALFWDDKLYLLQGEQFFELVNQEKGLVKDKWGQPENHFLNPNKDKPLIDGAFVDSAGKLYVFKDEQYIRYGDTEQMMVESGYPQHIDSTFKQLPGEFREANDGANSGTKNSATVNGAFTFAGRTYLIKDEASEPIWYMRYRGDDYGCLSAPGEKRLPALKFTERWGQWSDYRIQDLKTIARFKQLQESYSGDITLTELLSKADGYVKMPYKALADIFDWDVEEVKWLKRHNAFLPEITGDERRFNLELICRMVDIFTLANKLGTGVKTGYEEIWQKLYGQSPEPNKAADTLLGLLGNQHCGGSQFEVLEKEVHNKLNLLKRDAILPYAIHNDKDVEDDRDLYEKLLIDVKMGEAAEISPIKEAIAAVQLYFHRYFINLESPQLRSRSGLTSEHHRQLLQERWQWMRNYRVWEANRKVFLYPENYIRPELRDSKTPQFKALEESLLQGELNEFMVTSAFKQYIDEYIEVSNLAIAGGYVYDRPENTEDKNLVIFGHTKSDPRRYYYRFVTFVGGKSDAVQWQPWQEVNIQIDADYVYPVYAFNRIYLFWTSTEVSTNAKSNTSSALKQEGDRFKSESNAKISHLLKINYSYYNLNKQWVPAQQVPIEIESAYEVQESELSFQGIAAESNDNLDSISISYKYVAQNTLQPKLSDGTVRPDSLTGQTVYLQLGPIKEEITTPELIRKEGELIRLQALDPNLPIADEEVIEIVSGLTGKGISFKLRRTGVTDYYLRQHDSLMKAHPFEDNDIYKQDATYLVEATPQKDGYYLRLAWADNDDRSKLVIWVNNENRLMFKNKSELKTDELKQKASFNFLPDRHEGEGIFEFFPETREIKLNQDKKASIPNKDNVNFKQLFPWEEWENVSRTILLNTPQHNQSPQWVCYDYKGGSYLCKPSSGATTGNSEPKNISDHEPLKNTDFKTLNAAFERKGVQYFISGNQYVQADGSPQEIADKWGKPKSKIQETGGVDAALVRNGITYLFKDNQYLSYGSDYNQPLGGIRSISTNSNQFPTWENMDAALHVNNKTYFILRQEVVVKSEDGTQPDENLTLKDLWPSEINPKQVAQTFKEGDNTYLVLQDGDLIRLDQNEVETTLKAFENLAVPATSPNLMETVTSIFQLKDWVFFWDDNNKFYVHKGSSTTDDINNPFYYLKKDSLKGVFVEGDSLYTFNYDQNINVLYEWDKSTKTLKNSRAMLSAALSSNARAENRIDSMYRDTQGSIYFLYETKFLKINNVKDFTKGLRWFPSGDVSNLTNNAISKLSVETIDTINAALLRNDEVFLFVDYRYIKVPADQFPNPSATIHSLRNGSADGLPTVFNSIDAAFQGSDGVTHYFSSDKYVTSNNLSQVLNVADKWGKIRDNIRDRIKNNTNPTDPVIDAGFTLDDKTYLFSGDQYYRYDDDELDQLADGYPKFLLNNPDGFPYWPPVRDWPPVRAAFVRDGKAYLFDHFGNYTQWQPDQRRAVVNPVRNHWNWPDGFAGFSAAINGANDSVTLFAGEQYVEINNFATLKRGDNDKYDLIRLSSMTGSKLSQALFAGGIDQLLSLSTQAIDEQPVFRYGKDSDVANTGVILVPENRISPLPVHSHLEFRGANGIYYWELFYHAPLLIAQSLHTAQKFEEAKRWYEYVFDPTQTGDYWKFLPFLAVDVDALIQGLEPLKDHNIDISGLADKLKPYAKALQGIKTMGEEAFKTMWFGHIRQETASNDNPKEDIIKSFQKEFKLRHNQSPVLLVQESSQSEELTIAGFSDEGEFGTLAINDLNHELLKELKKEPVNESRIVELTKPIIGRTTSQDKVENLAQELEDLKTTNLGSELPAEINTAAEVVDIIKRLPERYQIMVDRGPAQIKAYLDDPFDAHTIAALRRIAYRRSTVMGYIDNLIDWGDRLFRQYTQESINEARMLYVLAYDLLGKKPQNIGPRPLSGPMKYEEIKDTGAEINDRAYDFLFDVADDKNEVSSLTHAGRVHSSVGNPYFFIPENTQLLAYWDRVEDRLYKIRHSLNIMGIKQPLPLFEPPIDPMALVRAVAGGGGLSSALRGMNVVVPHYRFTFMLNKARELVGKLSQFGNDLLGAIEKKDAEALSMLQNQQEGVILKMTQEIKLAQLNEARENLKNLEESRVSAENQLAHYEGLIETGMIPAEEAQIGMMGAATLIHAIMPALKVAAAMVKVAPDVKVGSPFTSGVTTGGSTLGAALGFIAEASESIAEALSMGGEIAGIYAQYQRTEEDWELQKMMSQSEIKQLDFQIEGAKWQIRAAEQELTVGEKEIDHNQSMKMFMQSKFSNEQLYQWMSSKLSGLYFQTYKMAHDMAKAAEKSYCFERGIPFKAGSVHRWFLLGQFEKRSALWGYSRIRFGPHGKGLSGK